MATEMRRELERQSARVLDNIRRGLAGSVAKEEAIALFRLANCIVPAAAVTYHIRVGVRRAGRRINDSRGNAGRTLCGAPITDKDAAGLRDARAIVRTNWHGAGLERCDACFQRLLALDFNRSNRVED